MAVKRIIVHCLEIEDKPGSLQKLLAKVASANVDLQCFTAFSAGGGRGQVYVSAKDPEAFKACAREAGIETTTAAGFIISGDDRVGAAAEALKGLADANISGVAGAAIVCDGQYHMLVVVDAADGDAA
jgi:hypothetical protein